MIENDLKYLIALNNFPKFGPSRLKKIYNYFHSYEPAFHATTYDLMIAGIEKNIADEFALARNDIDINRIMDNIDKENIKVIACQDENYPTLLSEIYDPPALLYYKGEMVKDECAIAVVGTRKFSAYGQQAVDSITTELAQNGVTIISGLALGVDTAAHLTALKAGGRTIAVLGTGIDKQSIYPGANRYLAQKICDEGGCCLTEFPLGTQPLKFNFPQRNRIISGLSLGTLVIEAGEKSGALITARMSLEQNREVFAVPGSIYSPVSFGPNRLIKQGACAVSSGAEIIEALDLKSITTYIENKKILPENQEEELIISKLTHEPIFIDEIIRETQLGAPLINSTLIIMEMKGMVKNLGGMKYVLAR